MYVGVAEAVVVDWGVGEGAEKNLPNCQVLPPITPAFSNQPMMLAADNGQMAKRQQLEIGGRGE